MLNKNEPQPQAPAARNATQAARVIARFGSASALARAIGASVSTVCRWDYPADKYGSDGLIPAPSLRKVLAAAKTLGIEITQEDLYPTRASLEATQPTRASLEATQPTRASLEATQPTRASIEATQPTRSVSE